MTVWIKNTFGEKFTFQPGMIESIKTNFEPGVEQLKIPITGAMSNFGIDTDGNGKTISITGRFLDTTSSVTNTNDIRSQKIMKLWFETFFSGFQRPVEFSSYLDEYSIRSSGTTVFHDDVSNEDVVLQASFIKTKVYIMGFTADDDEGDPEKIPFSLTLWVAGT